MRARGVVGYAVGWARGWVRGGVGTWLGGSFAVGRVRGWVEVCGWVDATGASRARTRKAATATRLQASER
eukprot:6194919-Pleurochrysis_carterae.AAC.1